MNVVIQRTRPVLRYSNVFTIVHSLQRRTPLVLDSSTQRGVQSAEPEPALSVSLFSLLCLSLSILILHWKRNLGRVAYSSIPIELSVSLCNCLRLVVLFLDSTRRWITLQVTNKLLPCQFLVKIFNPMAVPITYNLL